MRIASLVLALPFVLLTPWTAWPLSNDQPVPSAKATIADEKRPAQPVTLRVEEPANAYAGFPSMLTLHLKNVTTKVVTNLRLTASFGEGLVHETKARPVELNVPELKAGESKTFPLFLTPKEVWEYGVHISLVGDNGVQADAEAKVKATKPSSVPPAQPEYSLAVRSIVFGQAQARNSAISVSYLASHYELRTWVPPAGADGAAFQYWEPVTAESKQDYPAEKLRALTVAGTRLDSKELTTRLKEKATVLVFSDHEAIEPSILALFKPDTLILVLPGPKVQPVPQNADVTPTKVSAEAPVKKND